MAGHVQYPVVLAGAGTDSQLGLGSTWLGLFLPDRRCARLPLPTSGGLAGPMPALTVPNSVQNITPHVTSVYLVLLVEEFKMQNLAEVVSAVYAEIGAWAFLVHGHARLLQALREGVGNRKHQLPR